MPDMCLPSLILVTTGRIMTVAFSEIRQWEKLSLKPKWIYRSRKHWNENPEQGKLPYFIVGDEAFPLQSWLLRPFPGRGIPEDQRIFNYRLSRARRVIENAFGILSARWWIFLKPIQSSVEKTDMIIKASICLHNFLRQTNSAGYCPAGFVDTYDNTGKIKEEGMETHTYKPRSRRAVIKWNSSR